MGPRPRIKLSKFEKDTSQFAVVQQSYEDEKILKREGALLVGRSRREASFWESLRKDDLLLLFSSRSPMPTYACVVKGKSIEKSQSGLSTTRYPFYIHLEVVGKSVPHDRRNFSPFRNDYIINPPPVLFQRHWESCTAHSLFKDKKIPYSVHNDIEIYCSSSWEDEEFVYGAAELHPFGYRKALLSLIARHKGKRAGALLAEQGDQFDGINRLALRVFRQDYDWIRRKSITINRIYTGENILNKWNIHNALAKELILIAPNLLDESLSIIDGVSYDYHPEAFKLGFEIETPDDQFGAFYFWKPINVPSRVLASSTEKSIEDTKFRIHQINEERKTVQYWYCSGPLPYVQQGIKAKKWSLRRDRLTTGRWKNITKGDILFLADSDNLIRALATVSDTKLDRVRGFEEYPLWISFNDDIVKDIKVDIREVVRERWLWRKRGGINEIATIDGITLRDMLLKQAGGKRMWVEPNPYLLPMTETNVVKKQIFIVQSWQLLDSVYPQLKSILEERGYKVVYAGDRDGQVVFSDIWLMLNESEVAIVDFTNKRPNVYLEYGMALVLGKPIVAITQSKEDIPSDTPNLKYLLYQDSLVGLNNLKKQLPKAVRDVVEDIERMKKNH